MGSGVGKWGECSEVGECVVRCRLEDKLVDGASFLAATRHAVLVIRRDVAAEHRGALLHLSSTPNTICPNGNAGGD